MIEKIKKLINEKKDLNQPNKKGELILHQAIRSKNLEAVSLLIKAGADVNVKDEMGNSPLMLAAWQGEKEILKLLIQNKAEMNSFNQVGYTPLICAILQSNKEIVDMLLQQGADVEKKNNEGETALMVATKNNDIEMVSKLLSFQADINAKNKSGKDSLMLASLLGLQLMVDLLIEKGADIYGMDKEGNTSIMMAACEGHLDIVQLLAERGANLSQKNNRGLKAVELAAERGHRSILKYLIDRMGEAALAPKYKKLPKRFLNAVVSGDSLVVQEMIAQGIDINATDSKGVTPLMAAAFKGHKDLVQYFIEMGADLSLKNKEGLMALDYAIQAEEYELAAFLKSVLEREKKNPRIFNVIEKGSLSHLERFIDLGYEVNVTNEEGDTPLLAAVLKNDLEMTRLLLRSGAQVSSQNKKGEGVLEQIEKSQRVPFKMVQMLALLKEFGFPIQKKMKTHNCTIDKIILSRVTTKEEKNIIKRLLKSIGFQERGIAKGAQNPSRN